MFMSDFIATIRNCAVNMSNIWQVLNVCITAKLRISSCDLLLYHKLTLKRSNEWRRSETEIWTHKQCWLDIALVQYLDNVAIRIFASRHIYVTPLLPLRYCIISGTLYTVKAGYNEFDGTRENIPYNQKFLITKVTFYSDDYNYL
jgi:hypothetical protein